MEKLGEKKKSLISSTQKNGKGKEDSFVTGGEATFWYFCYTRCICISSTPISAHLFLSASFVAHLGYQQR